MTRRRSVLVALASACGLLAAFQRASAKPPAARPAIRAFHIAGVRFNRIDFAPRAGDRVRIIPHVWQGQRCLAVCTTDGRRIGFVPRDRIAEIAAMAAADWRLQKADPYAVPWKRYSVGKV